MSGSGQLRPGRPRDPEVDSAILRAAREVFVERGPEAASIEAVARRAGVSRLTIYRRYRDKQELLVDMLTWSRGEVPEIDPEGLTGEGLAELMIAELSQPQVPELLVRLAGAGADHPQLVRAFDESFVQPRRALVTAALERMQQRGRIEASADPAAVLDIIAGAVLYHLIMRPQERCPEQLRARVRAAVRHAGVR
jgi:AcrR family transcriptional regulator